MARGDRRRGEHAAPAACATPPRGIRSLDPRPPEVQPIAPDPEFARPEPPPTAWWRPLVLAVSCLVIGFVLGWMVGGDDGTTTVVAEGTTEATEAAPPSDTASSGTAPSDAGGTTVNAEEEPPPDPESVAVAVLNGTTVTGLAAETAEELAALGYADVATGNAPATSGASVVYYREGAEAAAERLAGDAGAAGGTAALPATGELADAVPAEAQVALVLGPG